MLLTKFIPNSTTYTIRRCSSGVNFWINKIECKFGVNSAKTVPALKCNILFSTIIIMGYLYVNKVDQLLKDQNCKEERNIYLISIGH